MQGSATADTHAVANPTDESIVVTAQIPSSAERVFRALTSGEITAWWVRPGVFDTREWTGDLRVGGAWRASGVGRGRPYALEGNFVEIDAPRRLAHTWRPTGAVDASTMVTYLLEPVDGGTRVTLRHSGFASPETREATAMGWRTSLARLAEILTSEHG